LLGIGRTIVSAEKHITADHAELQRVIQQKAWGKDSGLTSSGKGVVVPGVSEKR